MYPKTQTGGRAKSATLILRRIGFDSSLNRDKTGRPSFAVSAIKEELVVTRKGTQSILTLFMTTIRSSTPAAPVAEGNLTPMKYADGQ